LVVAVAKAVLANDTVGGKRKGGRHKPSQAQKIILIGSASPTGSGAPRR
jgi:hypothetical protein